MSATPEQKDEIRNLFRKHVPEVADGLVEIVSIAREVGRKCYVAVRSHGADVDPIRSCTGPRGIRLKAICADLNGECHVVPPKELHVVEVMGTDESVTRIEYFTVVRWEDSPDRFITNAFGPLHASNLALNPVKHGAVASIDRTAIDERFAQSWKTREDIELRLISELTGWKVSLRSSKE